MLGGGGVYGYPPKDAAYLAIKACKNKNYVAMNVMFYLHGVQMYELWQSVYEQFNT